MSPPTLPNAGCALPIPYSSSAKLRSIGALASATPLALDVSRELHLVCGTGGRVEENEFCWESVGLLTWRGRLCSEDERDGEVRGLTLLFQSGRSSGCLFCQYPFKLRKGGRTYLQLIQSIESIIATRDPWINLHLRSCIVRITHRPRLGLQFPLTKRDILSAVKIPWTSPSHNNRSALDLCQLHCLSRSSKASRQINLNNIMLL
jgi:hypothetical protein